MAPSQIMIVEDENIIAMDIQETLKGLGFGTAVASNGEDAVTKATEERPDLVLMDIVLPGELDGIEAARKIREHLDIPVVYLTAYSDINTLHRAKITEPFGYLLKPLKERELLATVEMALYKHKTGLQLKES